MKKILSLCLLLILTSCSSGTKPKTLNNFDSSMEAIVIALPVNVGSRTNLISALFGSDNVKSSQLETLSVVFKERITGNEFSLGSLYGTSYKAPRGQKNLDIAIVPPGTYDLVKTNSQSTEFLKFTPNELKDVNSVKASFNVKEGEVIYIGNIITSVTTGHVEVADKFEKLKPYIKDNLRIEQYNWLEKRLLRISK